MKFGIPPEENDAVRQRITGTPDRFLEIPGLDHGDHHDILREFLASNWTEDEGARTSARAAYSGSIGRWKKSLGDDSAIHAYYDFRDRRTKDMAADFLRENGIEPLWK
jgi:hypothetical protein